MFVFVFDPPRTEKGSDQKSKIKSLRKPLISLQTGVSEAFFKRKR